ncbi:ganglioside galactosyltransferase [Cichlidogyrus casuarinus]|uniref:Hexosyltransferase n=1 Tax=Cichlidogyrus casuarinus TaxID=1844966 RepID=A0ABD2Q0D0_9PLAT
MLILLLLPLAFTSELRWINSKEIYQRYEYLWPPSVREALQLPHKSKLPSFLDRFRLANQCSNAKYQAQPINILRENYLIDESICLAGNIRLLIAVHSAPQNDDKRAIIRSTWASMNTVKGQKFAVVFFLGASNDTDINSTIRQESLRHRDIVQRNFLDTYTNLTRKHVTLLEWIAKGGCPSAEFLLKVDDDVFVDIFHVLDTLQQADTLFPGRSFYCTATSNVKVIRRPNNSYRDRWVIPDSEYPRDRYPTYCEGFAYLTRMQMVPDLYWCSVLTPHFRLDDVYVTGILAESLGYPRYKFKISSGSGIMKEKLIPDLLDKQFLLSDTKSTVSKKLFYAYWHSVLSMHIDWVT